MSDFDFSPFSRSSIGFGRMFNMLENALRVRDAVAAVSAMPGSSASALAVIDT